MGYREEGITDELLSLTGLEFVKHFWGDPLTDEQAEYILWEKTCFPLGSPGRIRDDILRHKENPNGI